MKMSEKQLLFWGWGWVVEVLKIVPLIKFKYVMTRMIIAIELQRKKTYILYLFILVLLV